MVAPQLTRATAADATLDQCGGGEKMKMMRREKRRKESREVDLKKKEVRKRTHAASAGGERESERRAKDVQLMVHNESFVRVTSH